MLNTNDSTCQLIQSESHISEETEESYRYATFSGISMNLMILLILSMLNFSSPQGIWLLINQFQLYLLLFLTGAYMPKNIHDFLRGFEIFMLNFGLKIISDIPLIQDFINWINYEQKDQSLITLDIQSGSTIVNISSILLI